MRRFNERAGVGVTASMERQLADLRDAKGNLRRGGVMHLPRILSCDKREALASVRQGALIAASYEDREKPEQPGVIPVRPINNNDDHNAANRTADAAARQGGRPSIDHKERQVWGATR